MKLSRYAKLNGIGYRAAYEHFKKGWIKGAYQTPTGTIIIPEPAEVRPEAVVCYARVSSSENKDNLDRQAQRLSDFCAANGWIVKSIVKEVGSGLNDSRPKLLKILDEGLCTKIVVEHKDRLTRFGFSFLEKCCEKFGCRIVVINEVQTDQEDLIQDFISVITSFCARIYGRRRSKRKTEQLIQDLAKDDS